MAKGDSTVQLDFWGEQDQPHRQCKKCKLVLPLRKFHLIKDRGQVRGRRYTCKRCHRARTVLWRKAHPEECVRQRRRDDLRKYGLTLTAHQRMYDLQKGLCAICDRPETGKDRWGKTRRLAIDHDHATGQVRQLLCGNCNKTLGLCYDNPGILERAAAYLRKHQQ